MSSSPTDTEIGFKSLRRQVGLPLIGVEVALGLGVAVGTPGLVVGIGVGADSPGQMPDN